MGAQWPWIGKMRVKLGTIFRQIDEFMVQNPKNRQEMEERQRNNTCKMLRLC